MTIDNNPIYGVNLDNHFLKEENRLRRIEIQG